MRKVLGVAILLGFFVGLPMTAFGPVDGLLVFVLALAAVGLLMLAAWLLEVDR